MTAGIFSAPSLTPTERKIISFGSLPAGWRYGRGSPLPVHRVVAGIRLCRFFYQVGLTQTDAFAGEAGELMVTAYSGPDYLEVIIEPDDTYTVTQEREDEEVVYLPSLNRADALKEVVSIAKAICDTSGSFTRTNTIVQRNASPAWRLEHPAMAAYRLWSKNALDLPVQQSAPTSEGFIRPEFTQTSSFSGSLKVAPFRTEAA